MDDPAEVDNLRQSLRNRWAMLNYVMDERARKVLKEMIAEDEARLHELERAGER
jgi:hypothetical protein